MENSRAAELIEMLSLKPHPEGGWYHELYRSASVVSSNNRSRNALTSIYFLLGRNQFSRWHEVDADEVWHYYEGDVLELLLLSPDFSELKRFLLHRSSAQSQPVAVAPAGWWQAARALGEFTLCGCTVAPGFEFSGFRFMNSDEAETVREKFPELYSLV